MGIKKDQALKAGFEVHDQALGLPLYLHATGLRLLTRGKVEEKSGLLSPFVEIIWCISGIAEVTLYEKKYRVRKGEVFYFLPGEDRKKIALSEELHYRWLCFRGGLAEAVMMSYRYPRLQMAAEPYPEELFAELEERISQTDPHSMRRCCTLVLDVLARMGERYDQGIHSGKTAQRCIEYIITNFGNPQLGLPLLSDVLGVAPSTLSRVFRAETGVSPGRYILDRRLAQAMSLLRGTDLPVGEIAGQCGFNDRRTFSRFIRRSCECSPLELRRGRGEDLTETP